MIIFTRVVDYFKCRSLLESFTNLLNIVRFSNFDMIHDFHFFLNYHFSILDINVHANLVTWRLSPRAYKKFAQI